MVKSLLFIPLHESEHSTLKSPGIEMQWEKRINLTLCFWKYYNKIKIFINCSNLFRQEVYPENISSNYSPDRTKLEGKIVFWIFVSCFKGVLWWSVEFTDSWIIESGDSFTESSSQYPIPFYISASVLGLWDMKTSLFPSALPSVVKGDKQFHTSYKKRVGILWESSGEAGTPRFRDSKKAPRRCCCLPWDQIKQNKMGQGIECPGEALSRLRVEYENWKCENRVQDGCSWGEKRGISKAERDL